MSFFLQESSNSCKFAQNRAVELLAVVKAVLDVLPHAYVGDDAAEGIVMCALHLGDGVGALILRYHRANIAEVVLRVVEILRRRLDGSLTRIGRV